MRGKESVTVFLALFICCTVAIPLAAAGDDDVPRMTIKELKERLSDPDLIVLDVRAGGSWSGSESKIKGAVREDPAHVQDWMKKYPRDKTVVFYCS